MSTITAHLGDILDLAEVEQRSWTERLDALQRSGVPLNVEIPENWGVLLAPGLRKVFHARLRGREELFKRAQIFPLDSTQRAYEDYQGVGELGTDGWNQFEKTGRTTYSDKELGWKTRLEPREFAHGIQLRRKLIEDNLYSEAELPNSVTGDAGSLGSSLALHHEKSAASLFNNAFTDTGVDAEGFTIAGADGVGLCSTAHKHSPTNAGTQSNEGTLALSKSAVKDTALAMREFTDDKGNLVVLKPDMLLVPPELEDQALELVGTALDPESANNTINTLRGRYRVQAWDYLTDADAWFMVDSPLKEEHLVWLTRVAPQFMGGKLDESTMIAHYTGYSRYSRGFDAWQWIFGQKPA